jgi:hypothetical protein
MSIDYPGNSQQAPKVKETKTVERVTSANAVRRKKPLGKRFAETFVNADAGSVWNYIVMDVVVPAAKDMLSDAVSQGIDQMLFGGERRWQGGPSSRRGRGGSNGVVSYNRAYSGGVGSQQTRRDGPASNSISRRGRATHNFDEIIIPTRVEAEEVIDRLFDLVQKFELATVADLYDLTGITGNFTDEKWGWTDLRGAGVSRVKGGYLLDLPRPEHLD